jgi:uncharacterized protein YggE
VLVSYINFELSDEKQNEYKKEALKKASSDARDKAEAIALGQGKKIGRLVSLENQEFFYPGPVVYYEGATAVASGADAGESAKRAALNISPQEIEITASIKAQYKISLLCSIPLLFPNDILFRFFIFSSSL